MAGKNRYTIKTKELRIEPVNPENIWEDDWTVTLLGEKETVIGHASFAGDKERGTIPLWVELESEYVNKGYGTRVFKLMTDFAFNCKNIYEITAITDIDNDKCIYALEKAGFVYRKKEGRNEEYSISKPKSTWLGLYLYLGLLVGMVLVIVLGGSWAGLVIGLVIGAMFGLGMDNQERKKRADIVGKKE